MGPLRYNDSFLSNDPATRLFQLHLSSWIVQRRQAAEWGMRALQGFCQRLTTKLPFDYEYFMLVFEVATLLHNFRIVSGMGGNQIHTVYREVLDESINELVSAGVIGLRADGSPYIGEPRDDDIVRFEGDDV